MSNLSKRLVTGSVLVLLLGSLLWRGNPEIYRWIITLILLVAMLEWVRLAEFSLIWTVLYIFLNLLSLFLIYKTYSFFAVTLMSTLGWCSLGIFLPYLNRIFNTRFRHLILGLFISISLGEGLFYLTLLASPALYITLLILSVASFDSGAYFFGKKWGRHKLAQAISPQKSWEGVAGGAMSTASLITFISLIYFPVAQSWKWIILCSLTALFSLLGDLIESAVKRFFGKKDSGNWLPGHGGLLDRIDAYTAGTPFFVLGLFILGL